MDGMIKMQTSNATAPIHESRKRSITPNDSLSTSNIIEPFNTTINGAIGSSASTPAKHPRLCPPICNSTSPNSSLPESTCTYPEGNVNVGPIKPQGEAYFCNLSKSKKRRQKRQKKEKKTEFAAAPSMKLAPEKGMAKVRRRKTKRQTTEEEDKLQQWPSKSKQEQKSYLGLSDGPRSVAREQRNLTLMIYKGDGSSMDEAFAKAVRKKLSELVAAAAAQEIGGRNLAFAGSGLVSEGYFLITPELPEAMEWLLHQDLGEVSGIPVKIGKHERIRASIWIPGAIDDHPSNIILYLKSQNDHREELKIKEWVPISRESFKHGERLVMGVPQGVFSTDKDHVWLHFEFTKVQAKLIIQNRQHPDSEDAVEGAKAANSCMTCPHCGKVINKSTAALEVTATATAPPYHNFTRFPPLPTFGIGVDHRPYPKAEERWGTPTQVSSAPGILRGVGMRDHPYPSGVGCREASQAHYLATHKPTAASLPPESRISLWARARDNINPVSDRQRWWSETKQPW